MAGIQFTGLASGLDTESIVQELMAAERLKVDKIIKKKIKLEYKKEVWNDMNTTLFDFYSNSLFYFKSSGSYLLKNVSGFNQDEIGVSTTSNAAQGTHTIKVNVMAEGVNYTSKNVLDTVTTSKDLSFDISDGTKTETISLAAGSSVYHLVSAINKSDLRITANYDSTYNKIFINTTDTGSSAKIIIDDASLDADDKTALIELGLHDGGGAYVSIDKAGVDANFTYNGDNYISESNNLTINGMSFEFKQVMAAQSVINVTTDVEGIYNQIKDFINDYNELVEIIDTKINAEYNKSYEPLTQEEKQGMDDESIKEWETRIKDSILRRDDILTSINSSMRDILTMSRGVDKSKLPSEYPNLSAIGIVTGSWNENGKLHIEGDIDDPVYAIEKNELRLAIEDNPEKVAQLMTAIGEKLYSVLHEKMKSTKLSSALTFFNDKMIDDQIEDYEDEIYDLEERLLIIEERYYSQFTAMEKAIQQMNSQSSWIAEQLGGGA